MANCQLTVVGSKHSSDIYTRVSTSAHFILQPRLMCTRSMLAGYLGMQVFTGCVLTGCKDQGASKYSVVQLGWFSKLGGAYDGSINLSWRWLVT